MMTNFDYRDLTVFHLYSGLSIIGWRFYSVKPYLKRFFLDALNKVSSENFEGSGLNDK
jgi:hypothetical protein